MAIGPELDTAHLQLSLFLTRPSSTLSVAAQRPCEISSEADADDDWNVIYPVDWGDFGGALEAGARITGSAVSQPGWVGAALVQDLLGSAFRKMHDVGQDVFSGIGEELSNATRRMSSASTDESAFTFGYSFFH